MIGWLRRMFSTRYARLQEEIKHLEPSVQAVRHDAKIAEDRLRSTLDEHATPEKYRPSPLAESLGWRRRG